MKKVLIRGTIVRISNDKEYADKEMTTPCSHCGKLPTPEGFDACLGKLPGVLFACCGHGEPHRAYIYFENGIQITGIFHIKKVSNEQLEESKRVRKKIYGEDR